MKNKKGFIIDCIYYLCILTIILTITYIIIKWLLPFAISLLIVFVLQPVISHIQKICKIQNRFFRILITILLYISIIALFLYLLFLGMIQLYLLLNALPEYMNTVYEMITKSDVLNKFLPYIDVLYASMNDIIQTLTTSFIHYLLVFISRLPSFLFDAMFIIISSLFFIIDYPYIRGFILKYSNKKQNYVIAIIGCIKDTLSSLCKAYFIIFLVTFIELLIGCYIIGINDALMIAFAIALFDFVPVLGLDMIMVPWIVIEAIKNHMGMALGLLVVYIIVVITKNILEPKLISSKIGMHPLATILGMFLGMKVMGVIGMVTVPVVIMVLKRIYALKKEYTYE